jgi:hypothetical protein
MKTFSLASLKIVSTTAVVWFAMSVCEGSASDCVSVNAAKLGERLGMSSVTFAHTGSQSCDTRKRAVTANADLAIATEIDNIARTRCRSSLRAFCTELKTAQFNVPSGKEWMPSVPGLTPRAIKVRKNHVSLHYTFK